MKKAEEEKKNAVVKNDDGSLTVKKLTVALGEFSGHHHTIDGEMVVEEIPDPDAEVIDFITKEDSVMFHQEHGPIPIDKGETRVIKQRQINPFATEVDKPVRVWD